MPGHASFTLQEYLAGVVMWKAHKIWQEAVDPLVKKWMREAFADPAFDAKLVADKAAWAEEDRIAGEKGEKLRTDIVAFTLTQRNKQASSTEKKNASSGLRNAKNARKELGLEGYIFELKEAKTNLEDLLIKRPKQGTANVVDTFATEGKIDSKEVRC